MRLVPVEVFKYEELSEEGKKAVREYFRESDIEVNNNFFNAIATEVIEKLFNGCATDLCYSLSSSQGDGLSFMYKMTYEETKAFFSYLENFSESEEKVNYPMLDELVIELCDILDKKYNHMELLSLLDASTEFLDGLGYKTEANNFRTRYSHSRTVNHELDYDYYPEGTPEEDEFLLRAWQLRDILRELYLTICGHLEKVGYEIIYYEKTEDEFKEMCDSNEYEFTADGKLF